MCSCEDGEQPKVFERVLRKARGKRARDGYQCCECRRRIGHGDWYEEVGGLWDGTWDKFRTCLRCAARREAMTIVHGRPAFGGLHEYISDWEDNGGSLRELAVEVRTQRTALGEQIVELEAPRAERYRIAGVAREERKKALAWCGSGI